MGMRELRRGSRLPQEAFTLFPITRLRRREHLDGNVPLQHDVASEVHLAHAALPQEPFESVLLGKRVLDGRKISRHLVEGALS
jgi:hypothetical protein